MSIKNVKRVKAPGEFFQAVDFRMSIANAPAIGAFFLAKGLCVSAFLWLPGYPAVRGFACFGFQSRGSIPRVLIERQRMWVGLRFWSGKGR